MPKDEFDPDDPMELTGVALFTDEDTMAPMAECFVEEFMRMGHNPKQVLALFKNPYYTGMNMVLQNKGEQFVRDVISDTFAKWGRGAAWPAASASEPPRQGPRAEPQSAEPQRSQEVEFDGSVTDPMGAAIPKLNL